MSRKYRCGQYYSCKKEVSCGHKESWGREYCRKKMRSALFQLKKYENPLKSKHYMIKLREKTMNFVIDFDQPPTTVHYSVIHG